MQNTVLWKIQHSLLQSILTFYLNALNLIVLKKKLNLAEYFPNVGIIIIINIVVWVSV